MSSNTSERGLFFFLFCHININTSINIINNSNIGIRNKQVKHVAAAQTEQYTGAHTLSGTLTGWLFLFLSSLA